MAFAGWCGREWETGGSIDRSSWWRQLWLDMFRQYQAKGYLKAQLQRNENGSLFSGSLLQTKLRPMLEMRLPAPNLPVNKALAILFN
ncbi:hypothetical protein [Eikenella corrodens]|uniref:hypothetical protein n=1 Tax=Eikenella corrodens TaxID=539 RepID=UPI00129A912C|nr:hypothetical protein [Eikenella corrodens]